MTALNFINHQVVSKLLEEVEDDYDICIIDCSPGRFLLHQNIFQTSDLILIPNIPAPLSVYCNDILMDSLQERASFPKVLSFYNMVQAHKNIHKHFLGMRQNGPGVILDSLHTILCRNRIHHLEQGINFSPFEAV